MNAQELKGRIDLVALVQETVPLKKGNNGEWSGRCPFHGDTRASLNVNGDKRLWNCLGCGKSGDCFSWVQEHQRTDFKTAKATLEARYGNGGSPAGQYVEPKETIYDIFDHHGELIAQHIRKDYPDRKTFYWRKDGKDGLDGFEVKYMPLWGLPDFTTAAPGADVILTEGEKARNSLKARGHLALGTVCGANVIPDKSVLEVLVGSRRVYLWPDNDDAGQRHMAGIAKVLQALGVEVWLIRWEGAREKADAADYTGDIKALLAAAQPWPTREVVTVSLQQAQQPQPRDIVDRLGFTRESFLGRYLDYASSLTDSPLPFHLAGGITALAACCGSNVTFPGFGGRTYWPNIYALSIAPSGLFRKSTSLGIAQDVVSEVDQELVAPSEETRERFLSSLKEHPSVFYSISEFAAMLGLWQREYMSGMREIITDLYDPREQYVRQTMSQKITIKRPAVNILAATTIDWLREKLSEGDLRGGLMGRFLLFPGQQKGSNKGLVIDQHTTDKEWLVRFLKGIHGMERAWVDVRGIRDDYNAWLVEVEQRIESNVNPDLIGFQSRIGNHCLKLLVLMTVSQYGIRDRYEPTARELEKATTLAVWLMEQAEQLAMTGFTKSRTEQQVQKLIAMAARKGGIDRRLALRNMHMSTKEFEVIVRTAVERGQLVIEKEKHGPRTATLYRLPVNCSQDGSQ